MRSGRGWAFKRPYNIAWSNLTKSCKYRPHFLSLLPLAAEPIYFYAPAVCCRNIRYTPNNTYVAAFHFTIALPPGGPLLVTHPPTWYKPELVKTEKELEDEELKGLLARNLRPTKKKNKKTGETGETEPK